MDFQLDLLNPCTLMPTDFQLYRKMKQILFSVFFFAAEKRNWTSIFVMHLRITRKRLENVSPTGSREERS